MKRDRPKPTFEQRLKTSLSYAGFGAALGISQGVILPSVLNPSKPESTRYKGGAAIGGIELLLGEAPILGALIGMLGPDSHGSAISDNTIRGDLKLLLFNKGYENVDPQSRNLHRKDLKDSVVFNTVVCAGLGALIGFFSARAKPIEAKFQPTEASSWAERIDKEVPTSRAKSV